MTTSKIATGTYEIKESGRVFTVSYSESLNEWKIYEGENWWETVPRLKDAKDYIKEMV